MLAHRISLISASGTAAARAAAAQARGRGHALIDLTAGEVWADLIAPIRDGALKAIAGNASRYTDTIGMADLRESVAMTISQETGQAWSLDEVAMTAGAKQALFNTAMCLVDPGDQVIIPAPYWGTFPAQVKLAGGTPVFVDTRRNGYVPRIEDVERVLTPLTRAIIVNTPNNPTGAVYPPETLRQIAQLAVDRKLWLVFDECYKSFFHVGAAPQILSLVPAVRERLVLINAFSKSLAVTGWRIGYLAGPSAVIGAVRALQSHTTSNPNTIAQHAILHYLKSADRSDEARLLARVQAARASGLAVLEQLTHVQVPAADGGIYFYLDLSGLTLPPNMRPDISRADFVSQALLDEAGVATVSGAAFGDPDGLRLSYGISPYQVTIGCDRLVAYLNAMSGPASFAENSTIGEQP
jgi:aspartate aminotransferase